MRTAPALLASVRQQFAQPKVKTGADAGQVDDGYVVLATLDSAHVAAVDFNFVREPFL